jgi:pyrroline-5-carboxylate reductase
MRILFIGGGNMATALIGGLLQQGIDRDDIRAVEVSPQARQRLLAGHRVRVRDRVEGPIADDVVLLAVKPQQLREVAVALQPVLRGQLVISIAAGIRTKDLSRWLGGHARIVRAMPNTPALVGAGISGLFAAAGADAADRTVAQRVLGAVGKVVWVDREDLMDALTAVSGSGPAYVFYFIEALQQAAQESGFSEDQSRELAVETFLGAARLAAASIDPAVVLRERVTSKGGTTERALRSMEAGEIKRRLVEAVHAAELRSRELGDELGAA